ncbi:MAG: hypothetical protein KGP14_01800 [Betaproteobacteria bacterium]|nr:hypothetical protein [Betaproteobacteria bacterium]
MSYSIIPPRVPFADPKTGEISREWFLFLNNIFQTAGSGQSNSIPEVELVGHVDDAVSVFLPSLLDKSDTLERLAQMSDEIQTLADMVQAMQDSLLMGQGDEESNGLPANQIARLDKFQTFLAGLGSNGGFSATGPYASLPSSIAGFFISTNTNVQQVDELFCDGTGWTKRWCKRVGGVSTPLMVLTDSAALALGTGTTGLIFEPYAGGAYGAIYSTNVIPGTTNHAFVTNGSLTSINGTTNSYMQVNNVQIVTASSGGASVTGTIGCTSYFGCNNVAPTAPPIGYGTPINGARQGSFDATTITLTNLAKAVAQLIIDLKGIGLIAA